MTKIQNKVPVIRPQQFQFRSLQGGFFAALGLFASDVGYGYIAYSPLGHQYTDTGIVAAFLASILGTLIPALVRGTGPLYGGPRPAQTLIFSAMLSGVISHGPSGDLTRIVILPIACLMLAGLIELIFGLAGIGRVIRFTPLPVLAGFTNGVSLSMMLSAIFIILGHTTSLADLQTLDVLVHLIFVMVILVAMAATYRLLPTVHWSLVGLATGTLLHFAILRIDPGLSVGEMLPPIASLVPNSGIAALRFSQLATISWNQDLLLIVAPAISLATLNSLESLVISKQNDLISDERSDTGRVLIGQGLANIACGLLGALPSAPSNSRQLISRQMGSNTWQACYAFAVTMFLLLLIVPSFVDKIPQLAVAALLLYMAFSIVDSWSKIQLKTWWKREGDAEFRSQLSHNLTIMLSVMTVAITINLVAAMAIGVLLSMILFVRHNSRSIVARVYYGDKRHSSVMRPSLQYEYLRTHGQGIALVELSGPLFFGSGDLLTDEIEALADSVNQIILDFRQVGTIDVSGAGAIQRISRRMKQRGVRLLLAAISPTGARGQVILGVGAESVVAVKDWFHDADLALEAAEDLLLATSGLSEDVRSSRTLNLEALQGLSDSQLATLLSYTEEHTFRQGDFVFKRDEPGESLYLLLSGQVEIRVPVKDGPSKRLIDLRPGTMFGEMALLRGTRRSADAIVTAEQTEVLSLTRSALDHLHRENPDIALMMMRSIGVQLATRLSSVTEELRYALAGASGR